MITIVHVLIGGAVGAAVNNPAGALVAGVASHFVADMAPHLDVSPYAPRDKTGKLIYTRRIYLQATVDVLIAGGIVLALWLNYFDFPRLTPFVWGAFGGFLPDLADNVPFWKNRFRQLPLARRFHAFHDWTHELWESRFPMKGYWWLGVMTQATAVGLSYSYLTTR